MEFQSAPALDALSYGIKPVVLAIILNALIGLGSTALKSWRLVGLGLAGLVLFLAGLNEVVILFGSGLLMAATRIPKRWFGGSALMAGVSAAMACHPYGGRSDRDGAKPWRLVLAFVKIGAVIYGSGYVLLPFMKAEIVENLGLITGPQLLDAIAIGQVTPGPVFTTATFVGYLVAGVPGAILATLAIFLPSFAFVAMLNPLVRRVRESAWAAQFLDGVNVSAIALMAGVVIELRSSAIVDLPTAAIAVASLIALRLRVNATWLIAGAAGAGLVLEMTMGGIAR